MNTQMISNVSTTLEHKLHRFECECPITAEEVVRNQMQFARIYFQVLLEIEQERKLAIRRASSKFADLSNLESNMFLVDREIKELQSSDLNEKTLSRIAYLRSELKEMKIKFRDLKNEIKEDKELTAITAQIDQIAREKVKFARQNSGVYWGTYLLVEAAVSKKEFIHSSYPPPMNVKIPGTVINFNKTKDSEGRVGIRMQNPVPVKDIYKCLDSRFRLETTPAGIHAWLRVGSNPDNIREPIWAIFPVPSIKLPTNASITAVNVTNVVRGGKEKWFLDVWTLESNQKHEIKVPVELLSKRRSTLPPALAPVADVLMGTFQHPVVRAQRLVRRLLPKWVTQGDERLNERGPSV